VEIAPTLGRVTVETLPSVGRYAPQSHVLALSPQETSPEEVGPLRFCGRHLLDIRVQLGDSQQGKHVLLHLCLFSVVSTSNSDYAKPKSNMGITGLPGKQ
jgi:hypothetical protein